VSLNARNVYVHDCLILGSGGRTSRESRVKKCTHSRRDVEQSMLIYNFEHSAGVLICCLLMCTDLKGAPIRRKITLEEVKQHRTQDDAWMVYNGKVRL